MARTRMTPDAATVVAATERLRIALDYAKAALQDGDAAEAALALRIAMRQASRLLSTPK